MTPSVALILALVGSPPRKVRLMGRGPVSAGRVSQVTQAMPPALQFLVLTFAGWVNRHQDDLIAYLRWYRRLIAQTYDGSARRGRGRPMTRRDVAARVVRMAVENPSGGTHGSAGRSRTSATRSLGPR